MLQMSDAADWGVLSIVPSQVYKAIGGNAAILFKPDDVEAILIGAQPQLSA